MGGAAGEKKGKIFEWGNEGGTPTPRGLFLGEMG